MRSYCERRQEVDFNPEAVFCELRRVEFTSFLLIKRTSADAASQAFIKQGERNLQGVIDLLYFDDEVSE